MTYTNFSITAVQVLNFTCFFRPLCFLWGFFLFYFLFRFFFLYRAGTRTSSSGDKLSGLGTPDLQTSTSALLVAGVHGGPITAGSRPPSLSVRG